MTRHPVRARAAPARRCARECRSMRAAGSIARPARPARARLPRVPRARSSRCAQPGSSAGSSSRCRPTSSPSRPRSTTSTGRATSSAATRCSSSSAIATGSPRSGAPSCSRWLEQRRMSYVTVDAPRLEAANVPETVMAATGPLAYVRFHGRNAATWNKRGGGAAERFDYLYGPGSSRVGRTAARARERGGAGLRLLQQQQPDRRRRAGPGRRRAPAPPARGGACPGRLT